MTSVAFVIPGDLSLPTGGYTYDRRVLALLPAAGVDASHVVLPGGFPAPSPADLAVAERVLDAVPAGSVLLIDGLAYGAMPVELIRRFERPIVALCHHPLALEGGLSAERQLSLRVSETKALALARHVVVTSAATARILCERFGVARDRMTIAEPGTDAAARSSPRGPGLQLVAVGSIVPRKGYRFLIEALRPLAMHPQWHLVIAGATDRDVAEADALRQAIGDAHLQDRIQLAGAVPSDRLDQLYRASDIFIMPSLFEGYGMALAEAMARGLPIICTTGGAAAETVADDAAIKVTPGDAAALRQAIGRVLADGSLRQRMSDASWTAGQALPRWTDTASIIARVLQEHAR